MRAPSLAVWKPSRLRHVTCRRTSGMPLSGTMKPKPLATSNHLIRPLTSTTSSGCSGAREVESRRKGSIVDGKILPPNGLEPNSSDMKPHHSNRAARFSTQKIPSWRLGKSTKVQLKPLLWISVSIRHDEGLEDDTDLCANHKIGIFVQRGRFTVDDHERGAVPLSDQRQRGGRIDDERRSGDEEDIARERQL